MLVALFAWAALATDAEMYFSSDSNGANRVTDIQEGDQVWIVVYDPDQNIDCDLRDKMWVELKVFDPKTGAYIWWDTGGYIGHDTSVGDTADDYLEETDGDTGLFVSKRPFQVGTREDYPTPEKNTHVVDNTTIPDDFIWGHYLYDGAWINPNVAGDSRGFFAGAGTGGMPGFVPGLMGSSYTGPHMPSYGNWSTEDYLVGRFENMDTLVGMYQDPNDDSDVAVGMMKIFDREATISWGQEVYKDPRGAATITVHDDDENLNCNLVEYVPVFIIVNPGSWNPIQTNSATNFCMLKAWGGVTPTTGVALPLGGATPGESSFSIRWYNIYDSKIGATYPQPPNVQDKSEGAYYIQYSKSGVGPANVTYFDTDDSYGICRVMFYAQETEVNSGVFELNLNNIAPDLGFNTLDVRDVLVAYYLDPNDFDDFKLAAAYIEERRHSLTSFTDATRGDKSLYWIGRDPVYVQVIDANANVDPCCPEQVVVHICDPHGEDDSEWYVIDETSSNSPVFFSFAGMQLWPVWDALGIGLATRNGGYQLQLDNWKLEVFNEDSVYVRYNDVYYKTDNTGMGGLRDVSAATAFPPTIDRIRVDNDISFDVMEIADTQVYDGSTPVKMYFLDRLGNKISGYVNSDCVFVEVIDLDQDEDQYRRERIDGFWDGPTSTSTIGAGYAGQNIPFGPMDFADNHKTCGFEDVQTHSVNALLGDTNIFASGYSGNPSNSTSWAKLYVLNPRNGRWAAVDLLENGVASGDFVSVTCIDLVTQYECLPMLGVLPGDTIVAVYQDPSNHSDSAWISIKVGIGGGGTPPGQASTTDFVDAEGNSVTTYTDADDVYVKVIDPSHAGADTLTGLEVEGIAYDLSYLEGENTDTFITEAIPMADLGAVAGDEITANYADATDSLDTSWDTVPIISSELVFESFIAKPNPFSDEVTFTFEGAGIPETFAVTVYNMSGHLVWSEELSNVTEIVWDGQNEAGMPLANGPYIYVAMITDGTDTYTGKGKVFINK